MLKTLTLNQIVQRIKDIGNSHKQLKLVEFGEFIDLKQDLVYPCFLIDFNGTSIDQANRIVSYDFQFMFLDLADLATDSAQNQLEVWSDLTSISQDIFALMRLPEYQKEDWQFDGVVNGQYLREEDKDIVMGVSYNLTINTFYNNNRCQAPINT